MGGPVRCNPDQHYARGKELVSKMNGNLPAHPLWSSFTGDSKCGIYALKVEERVGELVKVATSPTTDPKTRNYALTALEYLRDGVGLVFRESGFVSTPRNEDARRALNQLGGVISEPICQ